MGTQNESETSDFDGKTRINSLMVEAERPWAFAAFGGLFWLVSERAKTLKFQTFSFEKE